MVFTVLYDYWKQIAPFLVLIMICRMFYYAICKNTRKSLEEEIVLLTGASSGIGASLAKLLYAKGAQVILASRRITELEKLKNEMLEMKLTVTPPEPYILLMDVASLDCITKKVEDTLKIFGRIDVLINNAGILCRGEVEELSMNIFQEVMNVNYFGAVGLTKAVLPGMIERKKGHIVAISSVQGLMAVPRRSAYAASKHALVAFMDSLRAEVYDSSIHVTCIHPGYVKTNISHTSLTSSGTYNSADPNIENGYSAEYVAETIVHAIETNRSDVIICPFVTKLITYLRTICPSLQFFVMKKIAKSENYY